MEEEVRQSKSTILNQGGDCRNGRQGGGGTTPPLLLFLAASHNHTNTKIYTFSQANTYEKYLSANNHKGRGEPKKGGLEEEDRQSKSTILNKGGDCRNGRPGGGGFN